MSMSLEDALDWCEAMTDPKATHWACIGKDERNAIRRVLGELKSFQAAAERLKAATPVAVQASVPVTDDTAEALEQCERILEAIDDIDVSNDFMESVATGVQSMREWIREHDHVTEAQQTTLDNWEDGVARWRRE